MKHRTINRLLSGALVFCFLATLITVPSSAAVTTDGLVTNTSTASYSFEGDAWAKEEGSHPDHEYYGSRRSCCLRSI